MPEVWKVDGYLLTEGAVRKVALRSGLYGTPGIVTQDTRIAGRHGRLPGRRQLDEGAFSLKVQLLASSTTALETARDSLLKRMIRTDRLVKFEHTLNGGSTRECLGYVADRAQPVPFGPTGEIWQFAVVVPSGRWRSPGNVSDQYLAVPADGRIALPAFASATAPMDDLAVQFQGPITNPRAVDARSGRGFTYRVVIPLGGGGSVNAGTWQVDAALLDYDGPTFFELTPGDETGPPAIIVTGSNMTAETRVRVIGRLGFLV